MMQEVLLTGGTKTTILTDNGVQVDVRVVEPEAFGAALQYFTGSKEHNVKLRTIAVHKGFKLSEYGIYRNDSGERIGGRTEEEMYRPLDMLMYPPELREDRGEIELGLEGVMPDFITAEEIRGDLHVHTDWSDGHASLRDMVLAARERGYQYLAISDHSVGRGIASGLTIQRLREQMREIRRLNDELGGITILSASEVDIRRDGSLDYPDELLAELDLCIGSVHSSFALSEQEQTARLLHAMENPLLDIIGHPTGRLIGSRDPIKLNMRLVMEAARQARRCHGSELLAGTAGLERHPHHAGARDRRLAGHQYRCACPGTLRTAEIRHRHCPPRLGHPCRCAQYAPPASAPSSPAPPPDAQGCIIIGLRITDCGLRIADCELRN